MAAIFPLAGAILDRSALTAGFFAAAIAVGAFVGRSRALFRNEPSEEVERYTAIGGLQGLAGSFILIVILVACVSGVIGAEIARHLPPAKRQR